MLNGMKKELNVSFSWFFQYCTNSRIKRWQFKNRISPLSLVFPLFLPDLQQKKQISVKIYIYMLNNTWLISGPQDDRFWIRLSQRRSLGFLVWCGRTRHERRAFARSRFALARSRSALRARTIALRAHSRATRSKARLVSKSNFEFMTSDPRQDDRFWI